MLTTLHAVHPVRGEEAIATGVMGREQHESDRGRGDLQNALRITIVMLSVKGDLSESVSEGFSFSVF